MLSSATNVGGDSMLGVLGSSVLLAAPNPAVLHGIDQQTEEDCSSLI